MKTLINISIFITFLFLLSCNPQKQISGYYSYETECIRNNYDGSIILKVWGSGKNKKDAGEQAKKKALRDVLFKGIRKGRSTCGIQPIIVEANALEKYKDYFYAFFAKNGPYTNFISNESKSPFRTKDRHHAGEEVVYGITVKVLRNSLKKQLIRDGVLKQ